MTTEKVLEAFDPETGDKFLLEVRNNAIKIHLQRCNLCRSMIPSDEDHYLHLGVVICRKCFDLNYAGDSRKNDCSSLKAVISQR